MSFELAQEKGFNFTTFATANFQRGRGKKSLDRRKALDNIEELVCYSKKPLSQPLLPLPQALVRQALNMNETLMQLTSGKADRRLNFDALARTLTALVH